MIQIYESNANLQIYEFGIVLIRSIRNS